MKNKKPFVLPKEDNTPSWTEFLGLGIVLGLSVLSLYLFLYYFVHEMAVTFAQANLM